MSASNQPLSPPQEDLTEDEAGATAATTTTQHTERERMELEMKLMEAKLREKFKSEEATLVENLKRRLEEVEARANNTSASYLTKGPRQPPAEGYNGRGTGRGPGGFESTDGVRSDNMPELYGETRRGLAEGDSRTVQTRAR